MKHYTTFEQSKKLLELGLSPESADMSYEYMDECDGNFPYYSIPVCYPAENNKDIPCWSLAALLDLIPDIIEDYVLRIDKVDGEYFIWYDKIGEGWSDDMAHPSSKNFIDAAFEMIIRLKENGKL